MKKIILIRHGQTTGDVENRFGGAYDDELSPDGIEQARDLVQLLDNKSIEKIYHSELVRAKQTADILNKTLRVGTEVLDGIEEKNTYGIMSGMVRSKAAVKYPDEYAKLEVDLLDPGVADSESYGDFKARVSKTFGEVVEGEESSTVAIVSHGGPIKFILKEFLDFEVSKIGNCDYFEIEVGASDELKLAVI